MPYLRWGGEEFLSLLPETDDEEATQTAERIRFRIASTVSVGLATYEAKTRGRNPVHRHGALNNGNNSALNPNDPNSSDPSL